VETNAAVEFVAELLVVQDLEISQLIAALSNWSKEEQTAVLRSFQTFKPGLLKRLLRSLAPMPKQCDLTLLITDELQEAQLISRHVREKDFVIRSLRREWTGKGPLSALMSLVLGKLYLKLNERARAEDSLQDIPFAQQPTEEELCEFYGGLGDLHFDLQLYELAEVNYQKAISKSEDPQSLTKVQSRLEHIQVNENYRRLASEATNELLAKVYADAASHLRQAKSSIHPDIVNIYHSIGRFYFFLERDFTRAEEYLLKSLTIGQEVLPSNHPKLTIIYNSLGSLYLNKGDNTRAEEYLLKCLSIWQEVLPANTTGLSETFRTSGVCIELKETLQKKRNFQISIGE
jgi:tetratricopeptide (TPR) repeat protein